MNLCFTLYGTEELYEVSANSIESMRQAHHTESRLEDGHSMIRTVQLTSIRTNSGYIALVDTAYTEAVAMWREANCTTLLQNLMTGITPK